jgi:hypothetical protein
VALCATQEHKPQDSNQQHRQLKHKNFLNVVAEILGLKQKNV